MIDKLGSLQYSNGILPNQGGAVKMGGQMSDAFAGALEQAITNLNTQENKVNVLTDQFVRGDLTDVHQLTIAAQKASLGLELAVHVRNKAVEAYQEIMRTQL
ncbi:flagellar hook-basal body complex protein FliE [Marinicrinis sediminis]|uniref:Flagellar hook-basal body complex protein FliE n=1 Tax=Marinicrinis sediminis TaxID=1652465 RepID=A0ABW5R7Q3_9BACL